MRVIITDQAVSLIETVMDVRNLVKERLENGTWLCEIDDEDYEYFMDLPMKKPEEDFSDFIVRIMLAFEQEGFGKIMREVVAEARKRRRN